nr:MAG TPA: hypothetical protein [Caudoviricetes sp.]
MHQSFIVSPRSRKPAFIFSAFTEYLLFGSRVKILIV